MNIALIAHDKKKELMVDFCIAYRSILKNHSLFSTETTGSFIIDGADLNVYKFSSGCLGGVQQIGTRVSLDELDLVIFLTDPTIPGEYDADLITLLRLCDANIIPFATNIATAEMLIKGLERGDLSWRENK